MFKEAAMAYLKMAFKHMPETAKENHKKYKDCIQVLE
jgi:hypothetical protein